MNNNIDDLQNLWQQGHNWQTRIEPAQLVKELKAELGNTYKSLKFRNYTEILAGVLMIPVFFYIGYQQENPLAQWGAWSVCLYALWVILVMSWMGRQRPKQQLGRPIREQLLKEIAYFQKEKKLLSTVGWWYILPLYLGLVFFHWGLNDSWWMFLIMMAITTWITFYILRLNQKAVRRQIDPLLERLKSLETALEA